MAVFGEEVAGCEGRPGAYWDPTTCRCRGAALLVCPLAPGNSVAPRGADRHLDGGPGGCRDGPLVALEGPGLLDVSSWLLLGSSLTMVFLLALTTLHYRRRCDGLGLITITSIPGA